MFDELYCANWLKYYLREIWENHPAPCENVRTAAQDAGYKKRELNAARKDLGVITLSGTHGGKSFNFWWLPDEVDAP